MLELLQTRNDIIDVLKEGYSPNCDIAKDIFRDFGYINHLGRNIINSYRDGQSRDESLLNLFDACRQMEGGLIALRDISASKLKPNLKDKYYALFSQYAALDTTLSQADSEQLGRHTKLIDGNALLTTPDGADLAWIDDLDDLSLQKARSVLEDLSKPGEPFMNDAYAHQCFSTWELQDKKSALKKILKSKSQDVVISFRSLLITAHSEDASPELSSYLYVLVEEIPGNDSEYYFKAELEGLESSTLTDSELDRKENGSWPTGSKDMLLPYVLRLYGAANSRAVSRLCVEVFLPTKLLSELQYSDLNEKVERAEDEGDQKIEPKNIVFTCPYVLRSLERARKAPKNQIAPLIRKWNYLVKSKAVIHDLEDASELRSNSFEAKLNLDRTLGFAMVANLPRSRSISFEKILSSGVAIFTWWIREPSDEGAEAMSSNTALRLSYICRSLRLDELKRTDQGEIIAPQHLVSTHCAAHVRFELAASGKCNDWVDRLMILHDHPQRWPRIFFEEQEDGGKLQSPPG